jgi:hypothetical protein
VVAAATAAALIVPAAASASFHLNKISEVFPGNAPGAGYIEIQAYSNGENFLAGHSVTIYDATGAQKASIALSTVPNGQSQRTTLIGGSALPAGVSPDVSREDLNTLMSKTGGAVCYDVLDCVSWGKFDGPALPSPTGTPVAPDGIPNGSSITRDISAGCKTLLEAGDDTNDSAADFDVTTNRTPRSNSEKPTEKPCSGGGGNGAPQTTIDKGPKKKTAKKTAKFKFSADDPDADFECSLDGKQFKPCTSPLKLKRIKPGKHEFAVRAVLGDKPDKTPATYRWKRIEKK